MTNSSEINSSISPEEKPLPDLFIWTPIRQQLRDWFRREATHLASPYEGAVLLLFRPTFPGRTHLICHVVRDILNILPETLTGVRRILPTEVYPKGVQELALSLAPQKDQFTSIAGAQDDAADVSLRISGRAFSALRLLLEEHEKVGSQQKPHEALAEAIFRLNTRSTVHVPRQLVEEFKSAYRWFVASAHLNAKTLPSANELVRQFERFEQTLHAFVGHYFSGTKEIDALLEQANPVEIDKIQPWLHSPQHTRYLFDHLYDPAWIEPLQKAGAFSEPPRAERVDGGVRYPPWPALKYLTRIAQKAPDVVIKIVERIETDNWSVARGIIDVATSLPANYSAKLVQKITDFVTRDVLWHDFDKIADVCVHLSQGGEVSAACKLMQGSFLLRAKEPLRLQEYLYFQGLKKIVPELITKAPTETLIALCGWLKTAVEAMDYYGGYPNDDRSNHWRQAIEEHPDNMNFELASKLVTPIRDGFEIAVRDNHLTINDASKILSQFPYLVFQRLEMHLVNVFADQHVNLARETMMKRNTFSDERFRHEYAMLVGKRFHLLLPEEQNEWLAWIVDGPDMSGFDESFTRWRDRLPTEEDRNNRKNWWKYEHLYWIRVHLTDSWRDFYNVILTKHGEPEFADLRFRSTNRMGKEIPLSAEELSYGGFIAAVEKVTNWKPSTEADPFGPTKESLANAFQQYVSKAPTEVSSQALLLQGCSGENEIFVRAFLSSMSDAIKAKQTIDLSTVLVLCRWVLDQNPKAASVIDDGRFRLVHPGWQWTRDSVARVITAICEAFDSGVARFLASQYGDSICDLLNALSKDSDQNCVEKSGKQEDPRIHDYLAHGINSARGRAVDAALACVRWIGKQIAVQADVVPRGLDAMPKIKEILEWQLLPENRSIEAASIFGSHLNILYWIDQKWLADHADSLFDIWTKEPSGIHRPEGWAAWNSFIVFCPPFREYYEILHRQFSYAIEQSSELSNDEKLFDKPFGKLGEHLIVLYARGDLTLDTDDSIIRRLLLHSALPVRVHAIEHVGRTLYSDKRTAVGAELPAEVLQRFVVLWEWYWSHGGKKDAESDPESSLFGYWFASGHFDAGWSLARLAEFVAVVPRPALDSLIVERLAEVADVDLLQSVHILHCLVVSDEENWRVDSWQNSARAILAKAIRTTGEARVQAEQTINLLGRRGFQEFGELLE